MHDRLTLTELHLYPIKSCAGIAVHAAILEDYGLRYDRNWVVASVSEGQAQCITQRELPRMARIQTQLTPDTLVLNAPGRSSLTIALAHKLSQQPTLPVTIWRDTQPAWDEGSEAADWLSQFLGQPVRLLRFATTAQRRCDPVWTGADLAYTRFADGYPLLLTNQASLDDLNQRLQAKGHATIPMNRFRPNIVVSGIVAYEEDYLASLHSAELILRVVKPCSRCSIPTIEQSTGEFVGPEPSATLSEYRRDQRVQGITFGQNLIIKAGIGQTVRVGQSLQVNWNF